MIAVDTSAIIAILFDEPEATEFDRAIRDQRPSLISAVSVFEAETVVRGRKSAALVTDVRKLVNLRRMEIVAFDDDQARLANDAYERFGKGHHPARLNLADCVAYALAQSLNAPLLYKGDDFAQTDIVSALTGG